MEVETGQKAKPFSTAGEGCWAKWQSRKRPTYRRLTGNRGAGVRALYLTSRVVNWNKEKYTDKETHREQAKAKTGHESRARRRLSTPVQRRPAEDRERKAKSPATMGLASRAGLLGTAPSPPQPRTPTRPSLHDAPSGQSLRLTSLAWFWPHWYGVGPTGISRP